MGLFDARGVPLSTRNPDSLRGYEAAVALLAAARGHPLQRIDAALERDPDFVMGHCLRADLIVLADDHARDDALRASLAAVAARHAAAIDRERRHAAAARAWLERDPHRAARIYGSLVVDYPHDLVALHLAHALDFRLGQREMLRDRVARVLPRWSPALAGYGSVLAMCAFGLEENGAYVEARAFAERALAAAPGHPAAIHVVAHVLEMQGRAADGIEWLRASEAAWADSTAFGTHLAWHLALFHLDRDETPAVLELYDRRIEPASRASLSAQVDASALLWRLKLRGVALHDRWSALADRWERHGYAALRPFHLAHAMMAFAAANRADSVERVLAALRSREVRRAAPRADFRLARPLCEALRAFGRDDYAGALARLGAVRRVARRCGGSVAQCDLIDLTLVEAALRSRRARLARALTAERAARRPASGLDGWLAARAALVPIVA